jgi:hypothetical protein
MSLLKEYYEVTLKQQNKWAALVGIIPEITIDTPLPDWIALYLQGWKKIEKKKQSRKKSIKEDIPIPIPTPIPAFMQIQPIIIQ